ncbi:MAG: GNAT family N-acetyltransferase, partial [Candidatus Eremiobacteraeota bacterium]|nr:GNAT family N-acetyltransferase [Candidatus Eremiobacteraeota bacterium]
ARGRGAGGELVSAAESYAWSRQCLHIEVSSDGRLGAEGFYEPKGYTVATDRFIKRNPATPP